MKPRSAAIDSIKGILVLLMIAYHSCYVAVMFGLADIELYEGFWWLFPRGIAAGFIAVSGWNLAGARARGGSFRGALKRTARLAAVAAAISVATRLALGDGFVFFGIIHFIALASIIAWPLAGKPILSAAVGAASLAAGLALGAARFGFPWLAWLGFRPEGVYPADYLPLLPWFAYTAFGAAAYGAAAALKAWRGRAATRPETGPGGGRPRSRRAKAATAKSRHWLPGLLAPLSSLSAALGKRSLAVYLVHLPLLYAIGWAVSRSR